MTQKPMDDGNYRVVGRKIKDGDAWGDYTRYNVLQKKVSIMFGLISYWADIDSEKIPQHVEISVGCFGDTGGWKSKFASQLSF
ncbi:hypothetical protein [Sulfitobacter sp. R18_1]|uniref:hypothetical protein n=1 Tax=Sulfitobacter sp. R18_1 TaxID=2821104 RepID=UPI001ADC094F|nr:hypothetical protein [Sulfitobacter sp. R18_1]MBO9428716.1 hypothetical protein [Sulfitobacter sp. R18_1]